VQAFTQHWQPGERMFQDAAVDSFEQGMLSLPDFAKDMRWGDYSGHTFVHEVHHSLDSIYSARMEALADGLGATSKVEWIHNYGIRGEEFVDLDGYARRAITMGTNNFASLIGSKARWTGAAADVGRAMAADIDSIAMKNGKLKVIYKGSKEYGLKASASSGGWVDDYDSKVYSVFNTKEFVTDAQRRFACTEFWTMNKQSVYRFRMRARRRARMVGALLDGVEDAKGMELATVFERHEGAIQINQAGGVLSKGMDDVDDLIMRMNRYPETMTAMLEDAVRQSPWLREAIRAALKQSKVTPSKRMLEYWGATR